jgi:cell division transport system permease protein
MILTKIKRVTKAGFMNFWRNGWVSLAAILIVVITLFTIGSLIFSRAILLATLDDMQDKVDISVYFKTDALEEDVLSLKESLTKLDEVSVINYVTREQALENFRERHQDNALITQSLEELGGNPLGAVINVRAKDPLHYESIAKFLEEKYTLDGINSAIDKVNYRQNKLVIDRFIRIIESSKKIGFGVSLVLIIISIFVTFNTIRLAIYTSRDEIGVMRLVGASRRFVSGPFIVEGFIYGVFASVIAMALFYPATFWLGSVTTNFFGGINLYNYYLANFFEIFITLLVIGIILCAFSSFIAVRRYLKV